MKTTRIKYGILCFFHLWMGFVLADSNGPPTYYPSQLIKSVEKIKLDGVLDETIWKELSPLPISMYDPINGGTPSERTEIMITYDDEYIYLGARLYVSNPNFIRINSFQRDLPTSGSEFNFFFTGDFQNLEGFSVNPAGKRVDAQMLCDTDCANWFNTDWNIIWDAKTKITDEGWFVEAKIPISSLNFSDDDGRLRFGFVAHRLIGAKNERLTFPFISSDLSNAPFRASLSYELFIENIKRKRPLYVAPFMVGKYEESWQNDREETAAFGIDAKLKISDNTSVDLTYNTDFSQVESDNQQINLTRFSLYYPEKRQFFQERSGIFTFTTGRGNQKLFHSRRIGLTNHGAPVKIIGGVRLVSKIKDWDIGVLNMHTDSYREERSENFGVLRLRRRAFNASSHYGLMFTSRMNMEGDFNYNIGVDFILRNHRNDLIEFKLINTIQDENQVGAPSSYLSAAWRRPGDSGLGFDFEIAHKGRDYNPEVGFVLRKDHFAANTEGSYAWFARDVSKIRKYGPKLSKFFIYNYSRNLTEYGYDAFSWQVEMKSTDVFEAGIIRELNHIEFPFSLDDEVIIPIGEYNNKGAFLKYNMSSRKLLRSDFKLETRELYDGKGYSFSMNSTWIQSKLLELNAGIALNEYNFNNRDDHFRSVLVHFKTRFSLNTKLSANLFMQYNSLNEYLGMNFRTRYNFRDGHDLFLVYNENRNIGLNNQIQDNANFESKGLYLKYIYTFH